MRVLEESLSSLFSRPPKLLEKHAPRAPVQRFVGSRRLSRRTFPSIPGDINHLGIANILPHIFIVRLSGYPRRRFTSKGNAFPFHVREVSKPKSYPERNSDVFIFESSPGQSSSNRTFDRSWSGLRRRVLFSCRACLAELFDSGPQLLPSTESRLKHNWFSERHV